MTDKDSPFDIRTIGPRGERVLLFKVRNIAFQFGESVLNKWRDDILSLPCKGIMSEDMALLIFGVTCGVSEALKAAANPPERLPDTPHAEPPVEDALPVGSDLPHMLRARLFLVRQGMPFSEVKALRAEDVREAVRRLATNEELFLLIGEHHIVARPLGGQTTRFRTA